MYYLTKYRAKIALQTFKIKHTLLINIFPITTSNSHFKHPSAWVSGKERQHAKDVVIYYRPHASCLPNNDIHLMQHTIYK